MRLRTGLVPGFFIRALAGPFTLGAAKYGDYSWRELLQDEGKARQFVSDRVDSMMNHFGEFLDGQMYDPEGPHHLAALAWNALMVLLFLCQYGPEQDFGPAHKPSLEESVRKYKEKQNAV